jgi:hypothetical protein
MITNWHNVSGKHFLTKEPLTSGRFPTYIETCLSSYGTTEITLTSGTFTTVSQRIEIYERFHPRWFEHPFLGSACDLVAFRFDRPAHCPEFMHNAANLISGIKVPVLPGGTVFIIGFPSSISIGFGLPLWKSGYIASEPFYDVRLQDRLSVVSGSEGGIELPAFFLDSQTRAGMSGSPVFAHHFGTWDLTDPYAKLDLDAPDFWKRNDVVLSDRGIQFIGCYSGRVGTKEEGAALGLCWREEVIDVICNARCVGQHPHVAESAA